MPDLPQIFPGAVEDSLSENMIEKLHSPNRAPEGVQLSCIEGEQTIQCDPTPSTFLHHDFQIQGGSSPSKSAVENVKVVCSDYGCTQVPVYYSLFCSVDWEDSHMVPELSVYAEIDDDTIGDPPVESDRVACVKDPEVDCPLSLSGRYPPERIPPDPNKEWHLYAFMKLEGISYFTTYTYTCSYTFSLFPILLDESSLSGNQTKDGKGDPRECAINSCDEAQGFGGDPIHTRTGNFDYSVNDLTVSTLAGPLSFQRSYASKATGLYTGGNGLGKGWTHNQQVSLIFKDGFVWFKGHTANLYKFHRNDDGSYTSYPGVLASLTFKSSSQTYELKASDQSTYTFDSSGKLTSWRNELGYGFDYTYASSKLSRVTEPISGRYLQLDYTGDRLTSVTDHTGRSISFGYDANLNLISFTDVRKRTWTYVYSDNRMTEIVAPGNPTKTILKTAYDSKGRAYEQWNGENQRIVKVQYNSNRTSTIKDALNRSRTDIYDVFNMNTGQRDTTGYTTTRTFDANFHPIHITDDDNRTTELQWSSNGANLLYVKDAAGYETFLQYNAQNHLVNVTAPENRVMSFTYNGPLLTSSTVQTNIGNLTTVYTYTTSADAPQPSNLLKAIKDPLSRQTLLSYDSKGQLITIQDALGQETRLEYDSIGQVFRVTRVIDQTTGVKTRIYYDPAGDVVKITRNYDPSRPQNDENQYNLITSYTYDDQARLKLVKDTMGFTTSYVYDDAGRVKQVKDAYSKSTLYAYNAAGQLVSVTDPLLHVTTLEYDSYGRLNRLLDPHGHASTIVYNPDSTIHSETDPAGYIQTYQYDDLKRVIGISDNLGRTVSNVLDAYGNVLATTDPLGRVTRYEYDRRGLLTAVVENYLSGQAANHQTNVRTEYEYDMAGNLWKARDANGHLTTYEYDDLNRPERIIDPLLRETSYTYDVLGNLASIHYPRGYTTGFEYDGVNRLQSIDYPGGSMEDVGLDYDPLGSLTDMYDSLGHTQWTNDRLGRVTSVLDPFGKTVEYEYDSVGNRTSLTYPDGRKLTYQYDEGNLLQSVMEGANQLADYRYDEADRLEQATLGNSAVSTYQYDLAGRLRKIRHINKEEVLTYSYQYNLAGNRLSETETKGPSYWLDLPAILCCASGGGGSEEGGTLTQGKDGKAEPGSLQPYPEPGLENLDKLSPDQERAYPPPSVEGESSVWQELLDFITRILAWATPAASAREGMKPENTSASAIVPAPVDIETSSRTISYGYDPLNRLTSASYSTGEQFGYAYDAVGNRLSQTSPQGTINYLYDAANQLGRQRKLARRWSKHVFLRLSKPFGISQPARNCLRIRLQRPGKPLPADQ
jgi:YD repeat-containing protein